MRRIAALTGMIALWIFGAMVHVDPVAARTPNEGDATGPNGGMPGGRWYSHGTVSETEWIDSYEMTWNPWPWPGRYEVKITKRPRTFYYLKEVCSYDARIWECTPGSERRTFQFAAG